MRRRGGVVQRRGAAAGVHGAGPALQHLLQVTLHARHARRTLHVRDGGHGAHAAVHVTGSTVENNCFIFFYYKK